MGENFLENWTTPKEKQKKKKDVKLRKPELCAHTFFKVHASQISKHQIILGVVKCMSTFVAYHSVIFACNKSMWHICGEFSRWRNVTNPYVPNMAYNICNTVWTLRGQHSLHADAQLIPLIHRQKQCQDVFWGTVIIWKVKSVN